MGSQKSRAGSTPPKPPTPILVAQPLDPPYRATGYRYTYRTYVFQVLQGMPLYPLKLALSQLRGEGSRKYRSSSGPLKGIAVGGIAEIISPIAAELATKTPIKKFL